MPRKIKILCFFGFRHSLHGLTPSKLKNFDQKLKISKNTQNFAQCSFVERLINTSLHHAIKMKDFIFFGLCHSFRGLTSLKLKNLDQKLKISTYLKILHKSIPEKD